MKYNAFKRGNQKRGGRIHRSTRASREELLAMTPAGRGTKLERAKAHSTSGAYVHASQRALATTNQRPRGR